MAEKGFFIIGTIGGGIGIGRFERSKGQKTKYHLEPIGNATEKPFEELKLQFENTGWEYICKITNVFYIFKALGEEAREVQIDPLLRKKEIKKIENAHFWFFLCGLFYFLYGCVLLRKYIFFNDYLIYTFVSDEVFMLIPSTLICIYWLVKEYKTIKILKHYLETDNNFYKEVAFNPKDKTQILDTAILLIFILALSSYFFGKLGSWEKKLADYKGEIPTISLSTIETNTNLQGLNGPFDMIFENTICLERKSLASKIYEMQEYSKIEEQDEKEDFGIYSARLNSEVFNLRFQFLVAPFLEDLVAYNMDLPYYSDMEGTYLEGTKFDQAYFATDGDSKFLFASVGKKVVYVDYYGKEDLSDFTDEIYQALVEFE